MIFSKRMGIKPAKKSIQIESIDDELRNTLWSLLTIHYWKKLRNRRGYENYIKPSNLDELFEALWIDYFKWPIDTIPTLFEGRGDSYGYSILRNYFLNAEWYQAYDFVEFISMRGPENYRSGFISQCNVYLEKENSGYRFVDGKIIEISSSEEISEIESAIEISTPYYGVKQHLETAIRLLSDRENPDYRNSIKESISAVETLCKKVTGHEKARLDDALKILEEQGVVHPALKKAFSSLYGYTSDADGIRHALMKKSNVTNSDARFMLVSCSAFINYVISQIN